MFSFEPQPVIEDVVAVLARYEALPIQYLEIVEVLDRERSEEKFPFLSRAGQFGGNPGISRELAA